MRYWHHLADLSPIALEVAPRKRLEGARGSVRMSQPEVGKTVAMRCGRTPIAITRREIR